MMMMVLVVVVVIYIFIFLVSKGLTACKMWRVTTYERRCERVYSEPRRLSHWRRLRQHSWKFHVQLSHWIRRRWIHLHRYVSIELLSKP